MVLSSSGDDEAPTVSAISIEDDGANDTILRITWAEDIDPGSLDFSGNFTITASGGAVVLSGPTWASATVLEIDTDRPILASETCVLTIAAAAVEDLAGNANELLTDAAVTNNSTRYPSAEALATELVSPTKLTHLFLMGDSRTTSKAAEFDQGATQIAWGGFRVPFNVLDSAGHDSISSGVNSGGTPTTSPHIGGNINAWCPQQSYETEFTGSAEPGANALQSRLFYPTGGGPSQANFPNFWAYAVGKECKFRALAYRHGAAPATQPGVTAHWRNSGTAFGGVNYNGTYVYNFTGSGYQEVNVTIPDTHDWATYTTPFSELVATPGGSTTAGEIIAFVDAWFEASVGTVLIDWSVGGRAIDHWRNDSVFDSGMFTSLVPLYGDNRMFWIDIGTNNPFGNDATSHAALVRAHIADFRVGSPGAPGIITSSYPAGTNNNTEPYYVAGNRDVGGDDGVLFLDTWNAMPPFFDGVELGYYDVDLYTANGAQSAGAGTLVVNETISGAAASGSVFVENTSGGIDVVPYASWSGSTFTLSGTLPNNVAANGRVGHGDGTHYNPTGATAFAETIGLLASVKAGTFSPLDIPGMFLGVSGESVDTSSPPAVDEVNDISGDGNHLAQSVAGAKPSVGVWRNGRMGLTFDGGDYLFRATLTGGAEAQPYTTFDVFQTPPDKLTKYTIFGGKIFGESSARGDVFTTATPGTLSLYAGAQDIAADPFAADTPSILEVVWNGSNTSSILIQDGEVVTESTGLVVGSQTLNEPYWGASDAGAGPYLGVLAARYCYRGEMLHQYRYVMREHLKQFYDITPL